MEKFNDATFSLVKVPFFSSRSRFNYILFGNSWYRTAGEVYRMIREIWKKNSKKTTATITSAAQRRADEFPISQPLPVHNHGDHAPWLQSAEISKTRETPNACIGTHNVLLIKKTVKRSMSVVTMIISSSFLLLWLPQFFFLLSGISLHSFLVKNFAHKHTHTPLLFSFISFYAKSARVVRKYFLEFTARF